jgi:hypothetical protein
MTRTSQLDAHYAVLQLDALRQQVVMSYRPTADMVIAEFDEKLAGLPEDSPEYRHAKQRRVERLARYRETLLAFVDAVLALRHDMGTDPADLPQGDDDVPPEHSKIRAAHITYCRQQASEPVEDDVDGMVEQHREALVERASAERERQRAQRWCEVDDALYAMRHGGEE